MAIAHRQLSSAPRWRLTYAAPDTNAFYTNTYSFTHTNTNADTYPEPRRNTLANAMRPVLEPYSHQHP